MDFEWDTKVLISSPIANKRNVPGDARTGHSGKHGRSVTSRAVVERNNVKDTAWSKIFLFSILYYLILSGPNKKTDGCDGESIEKNDCNNNECFEFPCCQYVTIKTNSKSFDYRTGLYKIVNEIVDDRYIYKQESGASIIFSTRKNVTLFNFSQFKMFNFLVLVNRWWYHKRKRQRVR